MFSAFNGFCDVEKSAFRFLMGEQPTLAFSNSSNHQATGFVLQEGVSIGETHHGKLMRSRCHRRMPVVFLDSTPGDVIAGVRDQLPESFPLWVGSWWGASSMALERRKKRQEKLRSSTASKKKDPGDSGDPFRRDAIDANSVSNRIPIISNPIH